MENILVIGRISATSKKNDGVYQQEVPTKTAYFEVPESEESKLKDFGLRQYTSKDDGTKFYIAKLPQNVAVYASNDEDSEPTLVDGTLDTHNFKTRGKEMYQLNIIKGHNKGNDFYRLQAVLVSDISDIEIVKPENPFAK